MKVIPFRVTRRHAATTDTLGRQLTARYNEATAAILTGDAAASSALLVQAEEIEEEIRRRLAHEYAIERQRRQMVEAIDVILEKAGRG